MKKLLVISLAISLLFIAYSGHAHEAELADYKQQVVTLKGDINTLQNNNHFNMAIRDTAFEVEINKIGDKIIEQELLRDYKWATQTP